MRIAVLGGGVAGVSAAIALACKGFDVSVYERRASPATIGAGVVCWPNASFVLGQLGVLDAVMSSAGRPTAMRRYNSHGASLGALDIRALNDAMGFPSLSVLRRDLMAALLGRMHGLGPRIRYCHEVTRITATPSGRALVQFDNGSSIDADVVIGADGRMESRSRAFVHGDARPTYQGFVNWVGVFDAEVPVFSSMEIHDYWGGGQRFGVVPIAPGKAYWAGATAAPVIGSNDRSAYRDELRALFSGFPEPVPALIADTPLASMNKLYVHDDDPISCWHRDNVILIGDAAHAPLPTSGQGACQALEDALLLADVLESGAADLATAFTTFTNLRAEKTARITMAGRRLARSLFTGDASTWATRDKVARTTDYRAMARGMADLWSSGHGTQRRNVPAAT